MATTSTAVDRERTRLRTALCQKFVTDFSRVGGLNEQIRFLKEVIVVPLLHADLYSAFGVKSPRGVIFYGPPGTGKTLVAAALTTELSKEGFGKVQLFNRKGPDILDKWVGESERKLRSLFEQATKNRPSIIFFDELDGLAPARQKNDDIHCSIVATLLTLMDGLSATPGVIVIGATNRLDAIDPALRRPGRFDKELYFPLPCTSARREILEVHMQLWTHKPDPSFITYLADETTGCSGADLQALCAEAFLCCLKRLHPDIHNCTVATRTDVDKRMIQVQECDFLIAKMNITPWTQKHFNGMKKLSSCIQPLLQPQLDRILIQLRSIWPHFATPGYKFSVCTERYAGKLLLVGTSRQGLNMHILPALLQALEHLPVVVLDAATVDKNTQINPNTPSILLLSRAGNLWDSIGSASRFALISLLEDIDPSAPLFLICTTDGVMPESLHHYFNNTSSVVCHIQNPILEERVNFFKPLFFGDNISILTFLQKVHFKNEENTSSKNACGTGENVKFGKCRKHFVANTSTSLRHQRQPRASKSRSTSCMNSVHLKKSSCSFGSRQRNVSRQNLQFYRKLKLISDTRLSQINRSCNKMNHVHEEQQSISSTFCNLSSTHNFNKIENMKTIFTSLISSANLTKNRSDRSITPKKNMEHQKPSTSMSDYDVQANVIQELFNRVTQVTTENCTVSELELLYDSISAAINMNKNDICHLLTCLQKIVWSFESGCD